jgi:hypothetical protein
MRISPEPAVVFMAAAALGLTSCSAPVVDLAAVSRFEQQFVMPPKASPLSAYARYYAPPRRLSSGDLPFTTLKDHIPGLEAGRWRTLVTAVYVKVGDTGANERPGVKLVEESDLPRVTDSGCTVVNVVFDPATLRTVDTWCNSEGLTMWSPPVVD